MIDREFLPKLEDQFPSTKGINMIILQNHQRQHLLLFKQLRRENSILRKMSMNIMMKIMKMIM